MAGVVFVLIIMYRDQQHMQKYFFDEVQNSKDQTKAERRVKFYPVFTKLCEELGYDYNNISTNSGYILYFWGKGQGPEDGFISEAGDLNECFKWGVEQLIKIKENKLTS